MRSKIDKILLIILLIAFLVSIYLIFQWVPQIKASNPAEQIAQRIFYFHVPSAWLGFMAFFVVFCGSVAYLVTRDRKYELISVASAEIGVLFISLVLITGPIWAKPIWGTWWVWDARLTSTLILWLIYVAYLMLRSQTDAGSMRARYAAVLGIVGFLNIPFIHFSVLWWRTFHPPPKMISSEGLGAGMDPSMVSTLLLSLGAFTLLYFVLMGQRVKVEMMRDEVERLKKDHLYSN